MVQRVAIAVRLRRRSAGDRLKRAAQNVSDRVSVLLGPILVVVAILIYLLPTAIAPLTFPAVYEDEPWVFLPMMEFARGNGLSFAALGEGQSPSLIFGALTAPIFWISPLDANITIRLLSAAACVCVLLAAYSIALQLGARTAFVAPAALLVLPMIYGALRYGRIEAIALALGGGAIAAALSRRFVLAGVLSAFVVSVHPIMVWIGVPCLIAIISARSWTSLWRYIGAGSAGLLPQILWTAFVAAPLYKYMVSSSISSGRFEVFDSLLSEPSRYAAFYNSLNPTGVALLTLILVLSALGIASAKGSTRWLALSLVLSPLAALSLFSLSKNPYYFVVVFPSMAVAAALGASKLPRLGAVGLAAALIGHTVLTHAPDIWRARSAPTVIEVNTALARTLPHGAVVFSPLREAGVIDLRPDLRFYSFHALSDANSWNPPDCASLDARIRAVVAADARSTSEMSPPTEAYLVMFGMPWTNYMAGIYGQRAEQMTCLWERPDIVRSITQICHAGHCDALDVRRRPLR